MRGPFLVIDAGNTSLRVAVMRGVDVLAICYESVQALTRREYRRIDEWSRSQPKCPDAVLAVSREVWLPLAQGLSMRLGAERMLVIDANSPLPFRISYPAGGKPGTDRLANVAALRRFHGTPSIALDFGTATTVDVVGANGDFLGGAILPGVQTGIEALRAATGGRLPLVPLDLPRSPIGRSTVECLQNGNLLGHVFAVQGLVRATCRALGAETTPPIVATGGLAAALAPLLDFPCSTDPHLTLKGLAVLREEIGFKRD